MELQGELQRLSGTTLDAQGAANVLAGTEGLDLIGALNVIAGTTGLELAGVLNELAGTTGLEVAGAAAVITGGAVVAGNLFTESGDDLTSEAAVYLVIEGA